MLIGSIWSEIHAAAFSCFKIPMFCNFNLYLISNMSSSVNSDECTRTRLQTNGFVVVHSYLLLLFLFFTSQSTIFQWCQDGSSWFEPVLSSELSDSAGGEIRTNNSSITLPTEPLRSVSVHWYKLIFLWCLRIKKQARKSD